VLPGFPTGVVHQSSLRLLFVVSFVSEVRSALIFQRHFATEVTSSRHKIIVLTLQ